jgi:Mg2+ and Co2+ transporter CorA
MMHRMLRFPSNWEWHVLHEQRPVTSGLSRVRKTHSARHGADAVDKGRTQNRDIDRPRSPVYADDSDDSADALRELKKTHPEIVDWAKGAVSSKSNHIAVSELAGEPVVYGTLMYQLSEDYNDMVPLHFWLSHGKLATIHTDLRLSIRMQLEPWAEKLNRCQTAPEALFVILGVILETFHTGLDVFETRLGELENSMRRNNRTGLMNSIFERRYDLLHWKHLFIPIREIQGAAKEAFLEGLTDLEEYKRMEFKLDRVQELLTSYAMEIDTLLMMDDAISNFRGNDIMKTLTIFTALFMPATVIGAVWGMNFDKLPWADETWGFVSVTTLIVVTTFAIYWWLWHKGWTGDLLYARKPEQIIDTSDSEERQTLQRTESERPMRRSRTGSQINEAEEHPLPSLPSRSNR